MGREAALQLVVVERAWRDVVVAARPFAVAGECAPAAVCAAAVVGVGRIALDGGGGALPEHGIGGVPPGAELELFEVGEAQVVPVDVDDVEKQAGSPGACAAAKAQGLLALALHEGVGTGCAVAGGEVVDALA